MVNCVAKFKKPCSEGVAVDDASFYGEYGEAILVQSGTAMRPNKGKGWLLAAAPRKEAA